MKTPTALWWDQVYIAPLKWVNNWCENEGRREKLQVISVCLLCGAINRPNRCSGHIQVEWTVERPWEQNHFSRSFSLDGRTDDLPDLWRLPAVNSHKLCMFLFWYLETCGWLTFWDGGRLYAFRQVLSFLIRSDNNFSSSSNWTENVDLSLSPEILVLLMLTLKDLQQMVSVARPCVGCFCGWSLFVFSGERWRRVGGFGSIFNV